MLLRLRADGSPDPNFGENGVYIFDRLNRGEAPVQIVGLADGKFIVTGNAPAAFVTRLKL